MIPCEFSAYTDSVNTVDGFVVTFTNTGLEYAEDCTPAIEVWSSSLGVIDPSRYTYENGVLTFDESPGSVEVNLYFEENIDTSDYFTDSFIIDYCAVTEFIDLQ